MPFVWWCPPVEYPICKASILLLYPTIDVPVSNRWVEYFFDKDPLRTELAHQPLIECSSDPKQGRRFTFERAVPQVFMSEMPSLYPPGTHPHRLLAARTHQRIPFIQGSQIINLNPPAFVKDGDSLTAGLVFGFIHMDSQLRTVIPTDEGGMLVPVYRASQRR